MQKWWFGRQWLYHWATSQRKQWFGTKFVDLWLESLPKRGDNKVCGFLEAKPWACLYFEDGRQRGIYKNKQTKNTEAMTKDWEWLTLRGLHMEVCFRIIWLLSVSWCTPMVTISSLSVLKCCRIMICSKQVSTWLGSALHCSLLFSLSVFNSCVCVLKRRGHGFFSICYTI